MTWKRYGSLWFPNSHRQAHIPFLIYQKLYFTAILHTHNTQLYFLSLLSDQFLFNAINLVCSIFITNEQPLCVIRTTSPIKQIISSSHISALCTYSMYHSASYFSLADLRKPIRFSLIFVNFYRIPSIPSIRALMVWITIFCSFGCRFKTRETILWAGFLSPSGFFPNNSFALAPSTSTSFTYCLLQKKWVSVSTQ